MNNIDEMLLVVSQSDPPELSNDFTTAVWSRIGEIGEKRASTRHNLLAAAMFLVAVGTGFGMAEKPALAHGIDNRLIGSTDYSPANLLQVSR